MKRFITLLLCFCIAIGIFSGCAKNDVISEEVTTESTEAVEEVPDWVLNLEETGCAMPNEITEAFFVATADESVKFIPVAYVANKESEKGMIYRILCQTTDSEMTIGEDAPAAEDDGILDGGANIAVDAESGEVVKDISTNISGEAIYELIMVDILVDFDRNATIDKIEVYDLNEEIGKTAVEMNDEAIVAMTDGWEKNLEQSASTIDNDILAIFNNAVSENNSSYEPLSYIGYLETIDGLNYAVLCRQTSISGNVPITEMAIMFISVVGEVIEILNIVTI